MHSGDTVTDSLGRSWQVGQPLGRGLWGGSWVLSSPGLGERVVKIAHARTDFPSDARLPDGLERACAQCVEEQASLLRRASHPFLPRLEDRVTIMGRPALILPRYATTLAARLADGEPLGTLTATLARVAEYIETMSGTNEAHGNLRPTNIFIKEDGQPVLADILTPTAAEWRQRLASLSPARQSILPPEAADLPTTRWDTWAICSSLYHAATWQPSATDLRINHEFGAPQGGLDKVELASVKDRSLKRLKAEGANPRFANRVCERLASLLNRGLSGPVEPSPPYRFHRAEELRARIAEVAALIHPRVESVGRLLMPSHAPDGVYVHSEPVEFTVTVGVTEGVGSHEHIAVGLRLVDLDSPDRRRVRLNDASFDVKPHPSGRLRFHFTLRDLPPGRYDLEAAFSMLEGKDAPIPARAEINVRPPPGYVPPLTEPEREPEVLTLPSRDAVREDPVRADAARFPSPIAPTGSIDLDDTSPTAVPPTGVDKPRPLSMDDAPTDIPAQHRSAPAIPRPKPTASVGRAPTPATPPRMASGTPAPTATVAAAPTVPGQPDDGTAWSGPGQWEASLPDPSEPDYVPTPDHVEDLPSWSPEDVSGRPAWARILDVVRNDTFTLIVIVIVFVAMLTLAFSTLLTTCGS